MSVPPNIRSLVATAGGLDLSGVLAEHQMCEGAKFHSPQPLLLRHFMIDMDGPFVLKHSRSPRGTVSAWLCATCADNLSVLLRLLDKHNGQLPWAARREFGNMVRALGLRAWEHHLKESQNHG